MSKGRIFPYVKNPVFPMQMGQKCLIRWKPAWVCIENLGFKRLMFNLPKSEGQ